MTGGTDEQRTPPDAAADQARHDSEVLEITRALDRASDLATEGKTAEALQICLSVLDREDLPARSAAALSLIMRRIGETRAADQIRAIVLEGIRSRFDALDSSIATLLPLAEALDDLEADVEAERLYVRAITENAGDPTAVLAFVAFLLQRNRTDEAVRLAGDFSDRTGNTFEFSLHLAGFFAHFGAQEPALQFLDRAAVQCMTRSQQVQLNFRMAALGRPVADLDQHEMAVDLFDAFAENYDHKLHALDNNGPGLVHAALEELDLPKTPTRRILDAGCGTGLCAGFLRDYAREIVGVDLSIKMLEKARDKQLYDFLARTDLSAMSTYPDGPFDMIVCADVLVYFGALDAVLGNLHQVLKPGGWLIATFEHELDPDVSAGFKLYPTARHKHTDAYIVASLANAGFLKPKLLRHDRLRTDMATPVPGTVIGVQKPALVTG